MEPAPSDDPFCECCGSDPCIHEHDDEPREGTYEADCRKPCMGVAAGCCNPHPDHNYAECYTAEMMERS